MTEKKRSLFERLFGKRETPTAPPRISHELGEQSPQLPNQPLERSEVSSAVVNDILARRARRAVESLLENEALTDGLDDSSAKELLSWAGERARQITAATAGLDDGQAEEATAEQMRSLRRLMRTASRWAAASGSDDPVQLDSLVEQAAAAVGASFPNPAQARQFLQQAGDDSAARMAALRSLLQQNRHQME